MLGSALDLIGNTPLIELARVRPGPARILAKAEFLQPGGSVKDRAAREILLAARRDGRLRDGQPVVEMTSGNMGAGLAVVCAVLGHALVVVMSRGNSIERVRMLAALGAEVILVDQVDGQPGQVTGADIVAATVLARRVAVERGAFYVDQFHAPECVGAHEFGTGPEIWDQTAGQVTAFVACVGSGGTFVGTARALKARNPAVCCVAVEPAGCAPLAGEPIRRTRHVLQGSGYGSVPPHWEPGLMDRSISVTDTEASEWRHRLAVSEGVHVGYTAAANVCAAFKLIDSHKVGGLVVTLPCDTGLKYPI